MSRRIFAVFLILAAGCSSTPSPENQMAPTPPMQARAQDSTPLPLPAPAPAPVSNDGIAARINNEILTWKDVRDALKEIKPADLTPELLKSKRSDMAEEKMFLQAARKNNLSITE